ncbi:MAG: PmoA family protein [Planctomycetaceae bacterium]|nr:PmoA family protein [Planctomycetaceae bacterium]
MSSIETSAMLLALYRLAVLGLCSIFLLALTATTRADDAKFRWTDGPQTGTTDLLLGDKPVVRYMALPYDNSTKEREHDTYKVYHHVFAPDGTTILTKGPGGQFTHHRGLYCAWNKTNYEGKTDDFWHCTKGASQRHVKFLDKTADAQHGAATVEIHWADADAKPVIIETRSVDVRRAPARTTGWQIDWRTSLASQRGEIKLEGDRQHAGFQYRAAQVVSEQKSARYIRPAGFPDKPEAVEAGDTGDPPAHSNLPWCAMTYPIEGQQVTVCYFEDPSLPKPSFFSERPYGRFGAFFKTTLSADKPLRLRYRLVITTGEPPARDTIQKWFDSFAAELKVADAK